MVSTRVWRGFTIFDNIKQYNPGLDLLNNLQDGDIKNYLNNLKENVDTEDNSVPKNSTAYTYLNNILTEINNINILDIFYCPHSPEDNCECRKPKPGMLLKAQKKYNINMKKSWLIGDKEDDITAANKSGVFNTILVKSGHEINESKSKAKYFLNSISELSNVIDK